MPCRRPRENPPSSATRIIRARWANAICQAKNSLVRAGARAVRRATQATLTPVKRSARPTRYRRAAGRMRAGSARAASALRGSDQESAHPASAEEPQRHRRVDKSTLCRARHRKKCSRRASSTPRARCGGGGARPVARLAEVRREVARLQGRGARRDLVGAIGERSQGNREGAQRGTNRSMSSWRLWAMIMLIVLKQNVERTVSSSTRPCLTWRASQLP